MTSIFSSHIKKSQFPNMKYALFSIVSIYRVNILFITVVKKNVHFKFSVHNIFLE